MTKSSIGPYAALAAALLMLLYFLGAPFAIGFLYKSHRDWLVSRPFTMLSTPADLLVQHCPFYEEYYASSLHALGTPLKD